MIAPLIIALFCYSAAVGILIFGLARPAGKVRESRGQSPGVSVVIPFKNEAANLKKLLDSLACQRYDGPYEVILVNDCSTDGYASVTSSGSWRCAVKVIDSPYSADRGLSSKQQALDLGIRSATFDWIALTDADMVLSPKWIDSLVSAASGGATMVFGHTAMRSPGGATLFGWLQSFQLSTLFAVAYALHRTGIGGSCMGNNLLIAKKTYTSLGGFDAIGYSMVEDRSLLLAVRKGGEAVATPEPFAPTAETLPCATFVQYRNQLLRWAYGGLRWNSILTPLAVILVLQNLAVIGAISGILPYGVSLLAATNLLVTWLFIFMAFRKTRSTSSALYFPIFYPVLFLETLLLPLTFIFRRPVVWKERSV
jgi:cellulose synthase/poly-beta-1,6-N-acetylglucosamine synthase-like glycosyltransferase